AQPGPGAAGDAGYRQADPGNAGGRLALGGGCAGIFRRACADAGRRDHPAGPRFCLYYPRGLRGLRWHRRVELPQPDRLLEVGSGLGFGQCDGVQAFGRHTVGRVETGRDIHRGRAACGAVQRGAGARCGGGFVGDGSAGGEGIADRIGADRAEGLRGGGGGRAACDDGTGRKIPDSGVR
ncbi:MAG: hypothetical protein ACD_10C00900G0001, partial [uncultured bacterium]